MSSRNLSQFVCGRCGYSVYLWRTGWQHSVGGKWGRKSCGQKPLVVPREEYTASDCRGTGQK